MVRAEILKNESIDKKQEFINRHLPEYIRSKDDFSMLYKVLKQVKSGLVENVYGLEHITQGEKLFISKHNSGEDVWRLIVALNEKIHIVGSETIHWKDQLLFGVKKGLMKQLEMLPVRTMLPEVTLKEKNELLSKVSTWEEKSHREILDRRVESLVVNKTYLKQVVAVLLSGQNVQLFVDGLWTRLEGDKRLPYPGYGLIARIYNKVANKPLNIIPIVFEDKNIHIGEAFRVTDKKSREELQYLAQANFDKIVI